MSNKQFLKYISIKLMEDLRNEIMPEPSVINGFLNVDSITEITALIKPTDKKLISQYLDSNDPLTCRVANDMLTKLNIEQS